MTFTVSSWRSIAALSGREQAVVRQVAMGTALKVIAADLSISIQAVSTYLLRAKRKLGVRSRADLLSAVGGNPSPPEASGAAPRVLLTKAEVAIAQAVLEGRSNIAIAGARGTSVRTVEHQVSRLLSKHNATSRAELIAGLYSQR